jgi:hypothetical protein
MDASLPPQLREALDAQGGTPLYLRDEQTQKLYMLIEEEAPAVSDEYLLEMLCPAIEEEARGEVGPLDMDEIKRDARRIWDRRHGRSGR